MNTQKRACIACIWFDSLEPSNRHSVGRCRRNPPTVVMHDYTEHTILPTVEPLGFCGEFQNEDMSADDFRTVLRELNINGGDDA